MGRRRAVSKPQGGGDGIKRRRKSASNPKEGDVEVTEGKSAGGENAAEISKEDGAAAPSGVHPLLMEDILEIVFEHIFPKSSEARQAKDVQKLRLVCKQWKDTATRVFRRNKAPILYFGYDWGTHDESPTPDKRMRNFLDVMKSSDLIPIQRYELYGKFFANKNQQLMKDFMRICGPAAVELRLSWDCFCSMKFTRRTFADLNLRGLKTLAFSFYHYSVGYPKPPPPPSYEIANLIEAVLDAAETLQEFQLKFETCGRREVKWPQGMVKRFGECVSKRIPKSVKTLHLELPISDFYLNCLAESELKLEKFYFASQGGSSGKVLRKFFEKQARTLKVLKIFSGFQFQISKESLDFPRLDELLHLELHLEDATIQHFSFPDTFPKLTTLNMDEWNNEFTYVEFLNCCMKKGMSLKEIHLPQRFPQAPLVKKTLLCFPNITKVHIGSLPDISETLQEVFINFDNIEELSILFPTWYEFHADSIFSGVSPLDCREIKENRNIDDSTFRDFQHRPSILNLTKLKNLVLHNCDILTDFSVRFIFLKMVALKRLYTNYLGISKKYEDLLRKKLSLTVSITDEDDEELQSSDNSDSD